MKTRTGTSASALIVGILSFSTLLSAQVRITAVTPAAAQPGAAVTITGNTFPAGVVAANVTANFAPVAIGAGPTVDVPLNTLVTVFGSTRRAVLTLPGALAVGASTPYHVTLSSAAPAFTTALAGNITINPLASLLSANPASGRLTQTIDVALTGSFSNFFQGVTTANLGSLIAVNSVTVNTPTSATANITINAGATLGARNVGVTTGSEVLTLTNGFTVNPAPTVLTANPNSGTVGNTLNVVLTGSGSTWLNGSGVLGASFGAGITVNTVTAASDTSVTANISISAGAVPGARNVVVTKGTETSSGSGIFNVLGIPVISTVNPNSGQQGQSNLSVALTGQFTNWVQGTTTANFGSVTVNSLTVTSSTTATAVITIPAATPTGALNVTATTGAEVATLANGFTVTAGTPVLTTVNPNSGVQGAANLSVALTGQFTHFVQGTTTGSFGAGITVNSVTVSSATAATASITIDPAAVSGARNVTLTTGGEVVTLTGGFTVGVGAPALTTVNPNTGQQGQTLASVALTGQFTHFVQGTTTASFGAGTRLLWPARHRLRRTLLSIPQRRLLRAM